MQSSLLELLSRSRWWRAESPMEHIAQGKRSDTLGDPTINNIDAPWKGKSINPLCCYSCLIADLAVLKWNTVCIFCSIFAPCLKAFALTGRDCSNTWYPGCRFACPGLCVPLGFQPVLAKSETWIRICYIYMVWGIFSMFLFCLLPDCWHSAALLHHSICL